MSEHDDNPLGLEHPISSYFDLLQAASDVLIESGRLVMPDATAAKMAHMLYAVQDRFGKEEFAELVQAVASATLCSTMVQQQNASIARKVVEEVNDRVLVADHPNIILPPYMRKG